MNWLPLTAVLLSPLPVTATEVALALDHAIVVEPGATAVVGDALIDALTEAGFVTVTVALWVTGPPFPCAVIVNVCVPTASPLTDCEPFVAVLLRLGPDTVAEVALTLDQVIVAEPGAVVLVGDALIDAATLAGAAMVTVWLIVGEGAPVESTAFAVKVIVAGPVSEVMLPESPSVPLPPPAKANPIPDFQTLT
jgi:hypothetical protein